MKHILVILTVCLFAVNVNAQVRWPFGEANTISATSADTIDVGASVSKGLNYWDWDSDTTIVLDATSIDNELNKGDLFFIEATESTGSADTINYGTGFTGTADPLPSGKTRMILFMYNGTEFRKVSSNQID